MLAASKPDALVAITVEHWANFFLNHMPAFCIGRADHYEGPVEDLPMSRSCPGDGLRFGCLPPFIRRKRVPSKKSGGLSRNRRGVCGEGDAALQKLKVRRHRNIPAHGYQGGYRTQQSKRPLASTPAAFCPFH
jgi:hypothetical protein